MNSVLVKEEVIIADIKPDPSPPPPPLQYSELIDASELPSSSQPCRSESSVLSSTADQTISKAGTTTAEAHHYKTVYVIPTKRPAPSDLPIAVKRVTTNWYVATVVTDFYYHEVCELYWFNSLVPFLSVEWKVCFRCQWVMLTGPNFLHPGLKCVENIMTLQI